MAMNDRSGFSLVELMVAVLLLSIITTAGFMLFVSSESVWSLTDTQIRLHQNLRQTLQRVSIELQESGDDSSGNTKVAIFQGAGSNNTDVLRFSIPLCTCGTSPMDEAGDVKSWGAPLNWSNAGCLTSFPVETNGKVKICHLPPGNPENEQDLEVSPSAVNAHLAHGDWLGDCDDCSPDNYTNHFIEYRVNAGGQLVRRVLDNATAEIGQAVMGEDISDFQVSMDVDEEIVTLTITVFGETNQNRQITLNQSMNVVLRNKG